jgi:hypothetical protein
MNGRVITRHIGRVTIILLESEPLPALLCK